MQATVTPHRINVHTLSVLLFAASSGRAATRGVDDHVRSAKQPPSETAASLLKARAWHLNRLGRQLRCARRPWSADLPESVVAPIRTVVSVSTIWGSESAAGVQRQAGDCQRRNRLHTHGRWQHRLHRQQVRVRLLEYMRNTPLLTPESVDVRALIGARVCRTDKFGSADELMIAQCGW